MRTKPENNVLPPNRKTDQMRVKVYIHAQLDPDLVKRLKRTASARGYRLGEFLEVLLNNVLPKE